MKDLKAMINTFIEKEIENNATELIQEDWCDSIAYYENDIKNMLIEAFDCSRELADYILDNSHLWDDEIYCYRSPSSPCIVEGEFSLASVGEMEIDLDWLKEAYGIDATKLSVRKAINDNTDLYISDSGYGYINTGYDHIALNFNNLDFEEWREFYLEAAS